jgi:predicted NBD/HSP70 family sugar kinase
VTTARTGPQPADFADVRATNLAVVLRQVRVAAPCSRADIAASTGLNKATVSSLVAELIERRMLRETGLTANRIGRPATMLVIDGSGYAAIGVQIGTDQLTAIGLDLAGRRVLTWHRSLPPTGRSPGRVIAEVARLARRAAARIQTDGGSVVGLTVAVPGLVDTTGLVRVAPGLGWTDVDLRGGLAKTLGNAGFPVDVDSDATLGAVAEHRYGGRAATADLAYLAGPPGGGVGIIAAGHPLRGAQGFAGAIGHLPIEPSGPRCPRCGGRGCLDVLAGVPALLQRTGTDPADSLDLDTEVAQLALRAAAGEPHVLATLATAGAHLAHAVAVVVNLLNPEAVLLGGQYAPLAPWLLPTAARELRRLTAAPDAGAVQLAASALGTDAPALGAAATALDTIDSAQSAFTRPA